MPARPGVDVEVIVIAAVIGTALLAILVLPMRKRWNEAGEDDEARRQAVARDISTEDE